PAEVDRGVEAARDLAEALDDGGRSRRVANGVQVGRVRVLVDADEQRALVTAFLRDQGLETLPGRAAYLLHHRLQRRARRDVDGVERAALGGGQERVVGRRLADQHHRLHRGEPRGGHAVAPGALAVAGPPEQDAVVAQGVLV